MKCTLFFLAMITAAMPNWAGLDDALIDTTLEYLASDESGGRVPGSAGHARVLAWLQTTLKDQGLVAGGQFGYVQAFGNGSNVIGVLPGKDPADHAIRVLVSAHYDHLETCIPHPEASSPICNGAADNAGGVAASLAAVASLRNQLQVPIGLALWDKEEGPPTFEGATFFVSNPTLDLSKLRLIVNLDIIGLNLGPGLEMMHFAIGAETGGSALQNDVQAASKTTGLGLMPLSFSFGYNRNDLTAFYDNRPFPMVFFTDGDGGVYHSNADELKNLNRTKVRAVAKLVAALVQTACERAEGYRYLSPYVANGMPMPIASDAATLAKLLTIIETGLAQLGLSDRVNLKPHFQRLSEIGSSDPANYSVLDAMFLGQLSLSLVQIFQNGLASAPDYLKPFN